MAVGQQPLTPSQTRCYTAVKASIMLPESVEAMSDEVEFQMTYPCYFLCGDRGGLVCITVNFVTCLCLFTQLGKLQAFKQAQSINASPDLAFPLEVAFATCDNAAQLISRLQ